MAQLEPKPYINRAINISDWASDQAFVQDEEMSSVQIGQQCVNQYDIFATYVVSNHGIKGRGSLVDRGANGGIAGDDTRVIRKHVRTVDVTGIDNHEMTDLHIVDTASWAMSNKGPVILIFHQYAYHGLGRSIHSAIQFEHYKNKVDDKSMKIGGRQCITTLEGHVIPLDIINGLPYMKMRPPSDQELRDLPHVIMTSGSRWNPAQLDSRCQIKMIGLIPFANWMMVD